MSDTKAPVISLNQILELSPEGAQIRRIIASAPYGRTPAQALKEIYEILEGKSNG